MQYQPAGQCSINPPAVRAEATYFGADHAGYTEYKQSSAEIFIAYARYSKQDTVKDTYR